MRLLEGMEGIGYHVYMDNYYTSPLLFKEMGKRGFGACGTARVDRKGMPEAWKGSKTKNQGNNLKKDQ